MASFSEYPSPISPRAYPVALETSFATPNWTSLMQTSLMQTVSRPKGPVAVEPSPKEVLKAGE